MLLAVLLLGLQAAEVRDLASDDPAVRDAASQTLAKMGVKAAPALIAILDSADPEVRGRAVSLLAGYGDAALRILEDSASREGRTLARQRILDRAKERVPERDAFTVAWREPACWDAPAVALEAGEGSGHGQSLRWYRLAPEETGVSVLSLEYAPEYKSYASRWPPETGSVDVRKGVLGKHAYFGLIRVLGAIERAELQERPVRRLMVSSGDFYASVRAAERGEVRFEEEYAGYPGTLHAVKYAKAQGALGALTAALETVAFQDHALTAPERAWVSDRLARDWTRVGSRGQGAWWVRERMLILAGHAADASALPHLAKVMREGDPKERQVYRAINAATRLLGKDVRGTPVEEMDVEAVRDKLLPLLEKH